MGRPVCPSVPLRLERALPISSAPSYMGLLGTIRIIRLNILVVFMALLLSMDQQMSIMTSI